MKKIFLLTLTFALLVLSSCGEKKEPNSQTTDPTDQTPDPAPNPDPEPGQKSVQSISLSINSIEFTEVGQTIQLTVTVTPSDAIIPLIEWLSSNTDVATVSNDGLVTCIGFGDATITVKVEDKEASCTVAAKELTVTDICGNKYKCVTIGSQVWMAENMRCEKYDTESNRAGESLEIVSSMTDAPYYTDASDESHWSSFAKQYGVNLSSAQIKKLGFLYNWAAVVGIATADEAKEHTSNFDGNRQGICPNGWHVPTDAEWSTLGRYVGAGAGGKLKTTSGWYNDGNGTDAYSFAVLPTGYANGVTLVDTGRCTDFWTATPRGAGLKGYANDFYISAEGDNLKSSNDTKYTAHALRCVRN